MGNIAFRLLLTFNATSLLVIIFCIQNNFSVKYFYPHPVTVGMPDYLSYLAYTIAPVLLTWLSLALSSFLGKDEFKEGETETIEHANNSFLPSYLGYFFVALSISDWQALIFVYGILFVFTFLSQALYFNPIFLLFGYEFYNVKTQSGTTIFLISRERYKNSDRPRKPHVSNISTMCHDLGFRKAPDQLLKLRISQCKKRIFW